MLQTSRRTPLILFCALAAITGAIGVASAAVPQLPDARQLIDRHIEAIGGRSAIEAHTSSHATGAIEVLGQGLVGTLDIYAAAPNKTVVTVNFPAAGMENRTGYDGETGWSTDSIMGQRLLQAGELQQLVDEADYYGDLHDAAKFSSVETVGEEEFRGYATYKVKLVYLSGREVFEYFDRESGRIVGIEGVQESIMGSMNVATVFEEYQQFGDVTMPTRMVQELGELQKVQITIETVEMDTVDPTVFDLPAAIQALIR